jgi:hypothetical protein
MRLVLSNERVAAKPAALHPLRERKMILYQLIAGPKAGPNSRRRDACRASDFGLTSAGSDLALFLGLVHITGIAIQLTDKASFSA